MGLTVAYLSRRAPHWLGKYILTIGFTLLVGLLMLYSAGESGRIAFGIPFSFIVLGAVLLENGKGFVIPRWMVGLGDASYAIYLIHNPLISLTSRILSRINIFARWEYGLMTGVAASLTVGIIYHFLVEKPLIRLSRKALLRNSARDAVLAP